MPPVSDLPEVSISEHGDTRYLHLGSPWVQGSMDKRRPFDIDLEYVQRMMAWMLFMPDLTARSLAERHAMQLGLGAAALTKFCHKRLRMKVTAIELNPQVLTACRQWFRLPADDEQLSVVLADAGQEIQAQKWLGTVDALQVDLYDHDAASPVLDTQVFYSHCRRLLTADGVMTVNLFGRDASYEASLVKIRRVFGQGCVWSFRPTREGNTVVLATRLPQLPDRDVLRERATLIENLCGLPARKWLRALRSPETAQSV